MGVDGQAALSHSLPSNQKVVLLKVVLLHAATLSEKLVSCKM